MYISVATANLYYLPFAQAIDIIAAAGYADVELALFWEGGAWAMAQHLRGLSGREAARIMARAGLRVASIHDGGGLLPRADSVAGYVNPLLREYIDALGEAPDCIVFHPPHAAGAAGEGWWREMAPQVVQALDAYRADCGAVTLENAPLLDGFTVPLTAPADLGAFCAQHGIGVTLDTTHYAQMGVSVPAAAAALRGAVRSVHLSDYADGRSHVFVGEGSINLPAVLRALDGAALYGITLECSVGFPREDVRRMAPADMVERLRLAGERLRAWLACAGEERPVG